jgi:hypothetical protein
MSKADIRTKTPFKNLSKPYEHSQLKQVRNSWLFPFRLSFASLTKPLKFSNMISHKFDHKSRVISIIELICLLLLASCKNNLQVASQPENKQQDPNISLELKQQNKAEDLSQTKGTTDVSVWKDIQSDDQQLAKLNEDHTKPINLVYPPTDYTLISLSSLENKSSTNLPITFIPSLELEQPKIPSKLAKGTQVSLASLEEMHIEPSQNKKRKALSEQKRSDLGDLIILPKDVLKIIMSYVGLEETSQVRQLNRRFYGLMTGYNQPGLLGVQQKPQSSMHTELWKANKVVDFSKEEYQALTPTNIPSFPFYQLVGEVKNLSTSFWPYLKGANVHTLYLSNNKIDDQGAAELAKYLKGTNVQELNLRKNQIGDQGAAELAKYLKGTNVHTLDLGSNQIGAQGAAELVKYLKGTNVHTLNLSDNKIGAQGATEMAKNLKGTNVHKLYLGCNKIGAQGVAEMAKNLKGTNVQELNVGYNQIGAQGATEMAKYLPGTNVHTLNLGDNQIGDQGATEMAKYLKGTNVHKLNLRGNQIGAQGATEMAKYLPGTNVQELNLRANQIGDQGAVEMAKNLKDTNVHRLNLGGNQIGAQGAAEMVKYLKGTNVHRLNLGGNQIGAQGATEMAKYLKDTNVHRLNLGGNQIGAQGATEMAKYLLGTNVQELNLESNGINIEIRNSLKKQYPNIRWIF